MKLNINDKIFVISSRSFDPGLYIWEITNINIIRDSVSSMYQYAIQFDQLIGKYGVNEVYIPKEDIDTCKNQLLYHNFKIFFTEEAFVNYLKNDT